MGEQRRGDWIQVASGRRFWPLDPRPEDIGIFDIAHSLARLCRFNGHVHCEHYSVAQHSILVSEIVRRDLALLGLLHDAAEAYLGDIPRPWKRYLWFEVQDPVRPGEMHHLKVAENKLLTCIYHRFGLKPTTADLDEVGLADETLLTTEARDLMAPLAPGWTHVPEHGYPCLSTRIEPWPARVAQERFLSRFAELAA